MEMIDLETMQMLTDKCLLSFFSEMTSNEITRNFTYTCYMLPGKCKQQYKSFGNENQARLRMKDHLLKHISRFVDELKGTGNLIWSEICVLIKGI